MNTATLNATLPMDVLEAQPARLPTVTTSNALEQRNASAPSGEGPADIAVAFLRAGGTVAELRDVLAMHRDWQRDQEQKAFNRAFAAFKAEAVSILKTKHVEFQGKNGRVSYDHAELADVVDTLTPALSKHGLGCNWQITEQRGDWIEITCTLKHELGGFETAKLGGPLDDSGSKNRIQAIISTKTYLERHTMKAVCGVAERGEDDDGGSSGDPHGREESRAPATPRDAHESARQQHQPTGLEADADAAAARGSVAYNAFWNGTGKDNRRTLFSGHERRTATAQKVDMRTADAPRNDPRAQAPTNTGRARPPAPRAPAPHAHR